MKRKIEEMERDEAKGKRVKAIEPNLDISSLHEALTLIDKKEAEVHCFNGKNATSKILTG